MEDQVEQALTKLDSLLKDFQGKCDEGLEVFFNSLLLYNTHSDVFSKQMRDMQVEHVIVSIFSEWENFLEKAFIYYALGEKSSKGIAPVRYVMPLDFEHAYRLIQNVTQYPDWSDIEKVLKNANDYFDQGGAFSVLHTMKSDLNAIKKMRNAIAHTSLRARKDFENLIQGKLGYLPDGITPATYLIDHSTKPGKKGISYFEHYIGHLKSVAEIIVYYSGEQS